MSRSAGTLAQEAAAAGVARLVLVSGIGADPQSKSPYIRARGRGELVVREAFPGATIVRPSAMFGPGDALFGTLADIVRLLPAAPLIGGGRARLQPVYVEHVAEAIARMLADRESAGRTYELAGPGVYTLRELVRFALRLIDKRRLLVPLPFAVAAIQARLFELLPRPPLDQPGRSTQDGHLGKRGPARFPRPRHPAAGGRGYRANLYRPAPHTRAYVGVALASTLIDWLSDSARSGHSIEPTSSAWEAEYVCSLLTRQTPRILQHSKKLAVL